MSGGLVRAGESLKAHESGRNGRSVMFKFARRFNLRVATLLGFLLSFIKAYDFVELIIMKGW